MGEILGIVFPIYALMILGFGTVRLGWFSAADMRTLGRFVRDVALPALLFSALARRDIAAILSHDYMLSYMVGSLGLIALVYAWFTLAGSDPKYRALAVMGSACPNNGFVGYPVMLLAFPDIAGVVLAFNFLVENIVMIPLSLILMERAAAGGGQGLGRQIVGAVWNLLKMPFFIGLMAGLLVSATGLTVPGPVAHVVDILAASAAALALFVVGGSLADRPPGHNRLFAARVVLAKLVLHPGLVFAAAAGLSMAGLIALTPDYHAALILSAAMPMFGIFTVFAQRLDLEAVASVALLAATTGAAATLSILLWWMT